VILLTLILQLTAQQQNLVDAIIIVESNGNDEAVGDNGNAIGCLQIWEIYHTDAVERSNIGGSYKDCYNREYAIKVFDAYMRRYAREAWTDPKQFNAEKVARIHNGGPRGYRKTATLKYWAKVERLLVESSVLTPSHSRRRLPPLAHVLASLRGCNTLSTQQNKNRI
jgi:soluble lytic murein transglycosylase-like protein